MKFKIQSLLEIETYLLNRQRKMAIAMITLAVLIFNKHDGWFAEKLYVWNNTRQ